MGRQRGEGGAELDEGGDEVEALGVVMRVSRSKGKGEGGLPLVERGRGSLERRRWSCLRLLAPCDKQQYQHCAQRRLPWRRHTLVAPLKISLTLLRIMTPTKARLMCRERLLIACGEAWSGAMKETTSARDWEM